MIPILTAGALATAAALALTGRQPDQEAAEGKSLEEAALGGERECEVRSRPCRVWLTARASENRREIAATLQAMEQAAAESAVDHTIGVELPFEAGRGAAPSVVELRERLAALREDSAGYDRALTQAMTAP